MARLFINKQTRKLSSDRQGRNPLSFDSLIPTAGAEMEIELFAVEATGPGTLTSPTITIASKDAPRGGTLSLSYDGTSLGEISVRAGAAEWEAYVNANTSISALGGMVVQIDDGRVLLVSRAAGVFADFAVVSSDLLPFGTAVLTQIQAGDANEREIWVLRTELGTIAVQNVFSQSSTVSATVTELISGGASAAEVQRIAISGEPVMGFWTITTASGMTLPLRWDVGPRHVEAAMNAKLGDGTVSVSQAAAFTFDVAWNAVGTQSPLTVGTGGLTGIQCSSATFTLDTAEAEAIPDWADAWVQITDSSEVIYSEQVTLRNLNLVGDQPVTQTAGVVRYDAAQTLTSGQQEQARTNISAAKSGAVTGSGLTMAGQRLLGRATGGVGALEEIQLGTGLALSGTYLSVLSSHGGQGAADGDMMVQFSADGSITATAGVHLTGDSGYVALYNDGALGVLFNPIDVNSHVGLLERKIALDQDTVWTLPNLSGTVMVGASNLSDVASVATARTNLGLTSLSTTTPGAGIATWLSTPSSANLAAALTDKTGTGAAVFASSPTLVTPILGTPTSGTLTNCTIPASGISTGIIPDDRLYPLRPSSFAGTYDDDFTGSSLDAKWSRQGLVSGDHTYQTANGSWMSMSIAAGATGVIARSIHQTWTPADATILCRLSYSQIGSAYPMMGPFITDASGNGVGVTIYNNGSSFAICVLSGWVFASFALYIAMGLPSHNIATAAGGIWFKLRKSGTTYYAAYSPDGHFWSPEVSAVNATTMTKVGMGTFYRAPGATDYGAYQHFDFFKIS